MTSFSELSPCRKGRGKRLLEEVVSTARARFPELFASVSKVPGLSGYTGAALVCFCGGMLRELTSKQLVSYLGLAPRISQSGMRTGKGLSITKRGDSYMRSLMYLSAKAEVAMRSPGFSEFYQCKVSGDNLTTSLLYPEFEKSTQGQKASEFHLDALLFGRQNL